jgi:hypothetical protein
MLETASNHLRRASVALTVSCPACGKTIRIYVDEDMESPGFICPDCGREISNPLTIAPGTLVAETQITTGLSNAPKPSLEQAIQTENHLSTRLRPLKLLKRSEPVSEVDFIIRALLSMVGAAAAGVLGGVMAFGLSRNDDVALIAGSASFGTLLLAAFLCTVPKTEALGREVVSIFTGAGMVVCFSCLLCAMLGGGVALLLRACGL